jgi:hypothetical protein
MDTKEQKALDDIEKYGCHVLQVMAEGELPPFSYSIGITKKLGKPEIIVVGLKEPIAGFVINEYNKRLRAGEEFLPGRFYTGFLEGFECTFDKVHPKHYREFFGWGIWLYKGMDFEVIQLIYPTTEGIWPWSQDAAEEFVRWQTILTETGKCTFAL